jgi:hypothetical protein
VDANARGRHPLVTLNPGDQVDLVAEFGECPGHLLHVYGVSRRALDRPVPLCEDVGNPHAE